jgi:hypothetical protein
MATVAKQETLRYMPCWKFVNVMNRCRMLCTLALAMNHLLVTRDIPNIGPKTHTHTRTHAFIQIFLVLLFYAAYILLQIPFVLLQSLIDFFLQTLVFVHMHAAATYSSSSSKPIENHIS